MEQCNAVLPKGLVGVLLGDGALGAALWIPTLMHSFLRALWRQGVSFLPERENVIAGSVELEVRMPHRSVRLRHGSNGDGHSPLVDAQCWAGLLEH